MCVCKWWQAWLGTAKIKDSIVTQNDERNCKYVLKRENAVPSISQDSYTKKYRLENNYLGSDYLEKGFGIASDTRQRRDTDMILLSKVQTLDN